MINMKIKTLKEFGLLIAFDAVKENQKIEESYLFEKYIDYLALCGVSNKVLFDVSVMFIGVRNDSTNPTLLETIAGIYNKEYSDEDIENPLTKPIIFKALIHSLRLDEGNFSIEKNNISIKNSEGMFLFDIEFNSVFDLLYQVVKISTEMFKKVINA